jgi:hypothetical protein
MIRTVSPTRSIRGASHVRTTSGPSCATAARRASSTRAVRCSLVNASQSTTGTSYAHSPSGSGSVRPGGGRGQREQQPPALVPVELVPARRGRRGRVRAVRVVVVVVAARVPERVIMFVRLVVVVAVARRLRTGRRRRRTRTAAVGGCTAGDRVDRLADRRPDRLGQRRRPRRRNLGHLKTDRRAGVDQLAALGQRTAGRLLDQVSGALRGQRRERLRFAVVRTPEQHRQPGRYLRGQPVDAHPANRCAVEYGTIVQPSSSRNSISARASSSAESPGPA